MKFLVLNLKVVQRTNVNHSKKPIGKILSNIHLVGHTSMSMQLKWHGTRSAPEDTRDRHYPESIYMIKGFKVRTQSLRM